uniref:Prefoldin subunit 1 n=2 Tax=Phasianinae TaxID=9072 RepID=A0A8C3LEV3_CHRPC
MVLSSRRGGLDWMLFTQSGEVLARLHREAVDAPSISRGVQGQAGWGAGRPGLVLKRAGWWPRVWRGVGTRWSLGSLPTRAILWFCDPAAFPPAPPRAPTAQAPSEGKMAAPVDLELKKAFTELQAKVIDTQQKVKLADIQIEQLSKTKKHAHLTDTEIMTLVDETRMYEGVGRMFILQSKGVIHNQLLEKQRIAEEKIKELEQKKSYLERSVKEAEDNIREMLMARRAQ